MSTKTVYQLSRAGLFAGETVADESPMEPGVWLMPAGAITTAPPAEWPDDQWPRWNGTAWELIPRPVVPLPQAPAEKLAQFLAANPDVAALIGQ